MLRGWRGNRGRSLRFAVSGSVGSWEEVGKFRRTGSCPVGGRVEQAAVVGRMQREAVDEAAAQQPLPGRRAEEDEDGSVQENAGAWKERVAPRLGSLGQGWRDWRHQAGTLCR